MGLIKLLILVIVLIILRRIIKLMAKRRLASAQAKPKTVSKKRLTPFQQKIFTVMVFTKLSTKRFFRDRLAIFFGILFPLIFLFVFGSLTSGTNKLSFRVAVINDSTSPYAKQLVKTIESQKYFKVDKTITTLSEAENKMDKNQLDSSIDIPANFGQPGKDKQVSGKVSVIYTQNNSSAGQSITSLLDNNLKPLNSQFVPVNQPFTVSGDQLNQKSLTAFDYTFAGLLGFSIIGIGIFGPINVFPELKKQGILRRLHTTPIRVWQYFLATMFSQAITGAVSILIQFIVAVEVFHLKIVGNYLEILVYVILSIFMILGIGLAIGGWAKNERQAAPLSNIIVFPMLFLSGTFFPRYLMPGWLQSVTNYLPLTPVIDGLRMLTTEGKSFFQIGTQLGEVGIWLVIIYIIAFNVFEWE